MTKKAIINYLTINYGKPHYLASRRKGEEPQLVFGPDVDLLIYVCLNTNRINIIDINKIDMVDLAFEDVDITTFETAEKGRHPAGWWAWLDD